MDPLISIIASFPLDEVVLTDFPYVELVQSWVETLKAIDATG
jgi:hypothetical protein